MMGSREFPYSPAWECEVCGDRGAWDIYGDVLCDKCCDPDWEKLLDDVIDYIKSVNGNMTPDGWRAISGTRTKLLRRLYARRDGL
jgi:hypothetical protein